MSKKDDLDQRRWVRYQLPVLVCVDTDEAGDQHMRHVVPLLDEIDMASDDQYNPTQWSTTRDGTKGVADHCGDDAARQAISHAGATKDRWVGEKPYLDWDWAGGPRRSRQGRGRGPRRRGRRSGVDSDAVSRSQRTRSSAR